eukprot:TRINITY_DN11871_c0_g1_i1.p1 TRINITY_DN11871_c0_g1~~TRINITY_DN11871_c0_g1_i1.p1  ORF type:complete len:113 (+),score=2.43 TRINITY_DN11871_c0_g1_i1:39-377(+)
MLQIHMVKCYLVLVDKRGALKHASKASEITKGQDIDIQLDYIEALIANSRSNEAETLLNKLAQLSEEQKGKKVKLQASYNTFGRLKSDCTCSRFYFVNFLLLSLKFAIKLTF